MKQTFIGALLILFITSSYAQSSEYRHMVSLGTAGLGWSGAAERQSSRSGSNFKSADYFLIDFSINYAYRLTDRFQLGAFLQSSHEEHKFNKKGGGSAPTELEVNTYGLFGLLNFSDDITNSYYLGLGLSFFSYEEETSHDFEDSEGKAPFELDDIGTTYELVFGKRWDLKHWQIAHITFAPQIGIYHRTHGKDFDDQKVGNGTGLSFKPIKFDVLF